MLQVKQLTDMVIYQNYSKHVWKSISWPHTIHLAEALTFFPLRTLNLGFQCLSLSCSQAGSWAVSICFIGCKAVSWHTCDMTAEVGSESSWCWTLEEWITFVRHRWKWFLNKFILIAEYSQELFTQCTLRRLKTERRNVSEH